MLVIAGLGNPGPDYAGHRHNVGFMAVDVIVDRHRFGPPRSRFEAIVSEGTIDAEKTIALKPMTYMNDSGRAVAAALRFYKLAPARLIVVHDELDLPAGRIKVKRGGGNGGHNGLRSIDAHIGPDYWRVRIGIGHPGDKDMVSGYVLHDFAKAERAWLAPLLDAIADNIGEFALGGDAKFMNRVARATRPAPEKPGKPGTAAGTNTGAAPAKDDRN
ncbi:MAG: aminoacyl-tRNA hydrolase [Alphaproteobacteria bacterium]|nr:aminoacyl-tRNA hydrolase [Alphaproteobacteria bacterium]